MEKDDSGNSTGRETELDTFLSAADRGMLDAIRDNLDLDTGLAQVLSNLTGTAPASRPTGPAEAEPSGHAHNYGYAPGPALACELPGAAHKTPGPAVPESRKGPRDHQRALTTLTLAVITALSIALLCSLSHNHGAVGAQSGASPRPITREPAREALVLPADAAPLHCPS